MSLRQKIKDNKAYKKWKMEIKDKQDNCEVCNKYLKLEDKQIHHTTPLAVLIKTVINKVKTLALPNKEFRKTVMVDVLQYQHNNNIGIVVCEKCHDTIHGRI